MIFSCCCCCCTHLAPGIFKGLIGYCYSQINCKLHMQISLNIPLSFSLTCMHNFFNYTRIFVLLLYKEAKSKWNNCWRTRKKVKRVKMIENKIIPDHENVIVFVCGQMIYGWNAQVEQMQVHVKHEHTHTRTDTHIHMYVYSFIHSHTHKNSLRHCVSTLWVKAVHKLILDPLAKAFNWEREKVKRERDSAREHALLAEQAPAACDA